MNIELLQARHAAAYRDLMLEAYATVPDAFTASVEERAPFPLAWWEKRLGEGNPDSIVLGAFDDGKLAGSVGLARETRPKTRHKADVFGMYVTPAHRKSGAGMAMMRVLIDHARAWDGVCLLLLTVTEGNAAAQGLYERFGFVAFGTEPLAIREGDRFLGKVHMALDLTQDLELDVTDLGWIDGKADNLDDQCAHANVRFRARGIDFVPPDNGEGLSALVAAWNLVKTLEEDRLEAGHDMRLIPCGCGQIWKHEGRVLEMGCPHGVFADVRRSGDEVTLTSHGGSTATVDSTEWRRAVVRFVDRVLRFYDEAPPRVVPEDAHERDGWAHVWRELREYRARGSVRAVEKARP